VRRVRARAAAAAFAVPVNPAVTGVDIRFSTPISGGFPSRRRILRHDRGLAVRTPVCYMLKMARSMPDFRAEM
jgi:hypothetical protein